MKFKTLGSPMNSGLPRVLMLAAMLCADGALAQVSGADTASPPLAAAPTPSRHNMWVNPGFYSAHFDTNKGLRNENFGLGVEVQINDDWSATAGRFINSDSAHSNYVGAYYQPFIFANAKWGVVMGAFDGYPRVLNGGWFPAVLPVATWESRWVGLNVALIPPVKDRLYGAVSFQVKVRVQD